MKRFLTIKEFAEEMNISRATVYREHDAGRLTFVKVGRATRIPAADADTWAAGLERAE